MGETPLRLGTRGSALALAQANMVAEQLGGAEVVPIRTAGDEPSGAGVAAGAPAPAAGARGAAHPAAGGDKARFVREIERALLDGEVDFAVHSAKDLPLELPRGLEIAGVPAREDPRDAYLGTGGSLKELPEGATIGTSSLRRRSQLLAHRPDLQIRELRGNVDTRLRRLADGDFDGIVLAAAGLRRLGREDEISFTFETSELTPAPGQGALAIEGPSGDEWIEAGAAHSITDREALAEISCERAVVAALGASCDTPVGASADVRSDRIVVLGYCGLPDGSEWIRDRVEGDASDPEALGRELAARMLSAGASEILERSARRVAEGL